MTSRPSRFFTVALAAILLAGTAGAAAGATPIRIQVDASEITRHVVHVALHIPARPGPLTLLYPKWIPGEHAPSGPISEVAGLSITAAGTPVPWARDLVEMYEIHCEVPRGAAAIDVSLDFLPPVEPSSFPLPASATSRLAVLNWNQLLLYPGGTPPDSLIYTASLRLPPGWKFGTALRVAREGAGTVEFSPVPLVTLVDSPLNMGEYTRVVRLAPDITPAHEIDIAADSREALAMDSTQVAHYSRLVREAGAVFGTYHYRDYHFLLTLSDHIPGFGLEHHESSDNRMQERALLTPEIQTAHADLLPHEYAHSWCGKYRRPADLASAPYLEAQRTDLLWVYEGLTMYLGWVLAARSGLLTAEEAREFLAVMAASQDFQAGRSWRPLLDTAISAHVIYRAGSGWGAWKRGVDYYEEGLLLWLEADALIRERTSGQRSLDDFLRRFLGGETGRPELKTYVFDDVMADLNAVAPYDWASFWRTRIDRVARRAPIGGIEGDGWKLVYVDSLSTYQKALETAHKRIDLTYSLGLVLEEDGRIRDIIPASPFARAGGAPGMRLVAVNGRKWTPDVLRNAVRAAAKATAPIELLTESADYYATCRVEYHGGERYPRLIREAAKPDYLTALLSPHAPAGAR